MPVEGGRAVSEVIGAVLIFGLLVTTFTIYQGIIIPEQNRTVEFEHNLAVQGVMQDLRNAIRHTAMAATEESISIQLAASYPQRFIAINPGGSAGNIRSESLGTITVKNVTAADRETADYFGNTTTTLGPFDSKAIVYTPVYYRYRKAPTTSYENTLTVNHFPGGANLTLTQQSMIDGRKITLVAIDGNLSHNGRETETIDTDAISTSSRAIAVKNESGPLNITINTRLSATNWTNILEDELDGAGSDDQFVTEVKKTGPNQVSILLEQGVTYELRLAKVGVGTGATATGPKYIITQRGHNTSVIQNGSRKLMVEVRDRFNNPVSNVTVNATITQRANADDPHEEVAPANDTTGADGQATFLYSAPEKSEGDQTAKVTVEFDGDGTANESAVFEMDVISPDDDTLGGSSDPATQAGDASGLIQLQDTFPPASDSEPYEFVTFQIENTANESVNISGMRVAYATQSDNSGTVEDGPDEVIDIAVGGDSRTVSAIEGQNPVFFEDNPITLAGDDTVSDIELQLDDTYLLSKNKEALIISVTFYFEGGFSAEYAVYMFNA